MILLSGNNLIDVEKTCANWEAYSSHGWISVREQFE